MKFIEVTTKDGIQLEVAVDQICFVYRKPMEPIYTLGQPGAMTAVDSVLTPYDKLTSQLDFQFVTFDIPEATTAYVNPKHVLFIASPQLGTTVMMFLGGLKLVVKEGITEVRKKLSGNPSITLLDP